MEYSKKIPKIVRRLDLPQGQVKELASVLSKMLPVYNSSNSHEYKIFRKDGTSIHKKYNVAGNKICDFAHLLYELSLTDVGNAAIVYTLQNSEPDTRKKLKETLGKGGKEFIHGEKFGYGSFNRISVAEAIKDMITIAKESKEEIISKNDIKLIISVLASNRNKGKMLLNTIKEGGVPNEYFDRVKDTGTQI